MLYAAEPLRCDLGLYTMRGAYACAAVLGLGRDVPGVPFVGLVDGDRFGWGMGGLKRWAGMGWV